MFCGVCGSAVQPTDRFCPKCGQSVAPPGTAAPAISSTAPAPAIPGTVSAPGYAAPAGYTAQPGYASPGGYAPQVGYAVPGVAGRRYAGFWLRFVAYLVDGLIVGIPVAILVIVFIAIFGGLAALHLPNVNNPNPDPAQVVGFLAAIFAAILPIILVSVAFSWLYFAMMESSAKQATLGKAMLSLRVTDYNGQRISFGRATGRYFSKIITNLVPLAIGWILAGFTERKQALHDFIAGTLVWRDN
jgi:uncharacterized RDD family membrane protein YckC